MNRLSCLLACALLACGEPAPEEPAPEDPIAVDHGVDLASKTIRIGALNDESGPAAAVGKPFAYGKRVLAAQVNAGGSGILPDGWSVELIEKDHGYNPTASVAAYNEIAPEVLFIGTSFGTPNTLPLQPMLERDDVVAFPASLSSEMAKNTHTPPLGPSYQVEAWRAADWAVEHAGGSPKLAIVYQHDDYGEDGLIGWKGAAEAHGLELVSEQTISPGQKDFAAVVTTLKDSGADHVLLTTLPSATAPILGTAAALEYGPTWIGSTPAWIDTFFDPKVVPSGVFANYHQMSGLPYWGEEVPGMTAFLEAFDAHRGDAPQDSYVLLSYIQGLVQLEAARRAIESGDLTRAGYRAALGTIDAFDAGGMTQPIDLSYFPYVVGTRTRVLKPDFEKSTWTVVSDYAEPEILAEPTTADP